MSKLRPLPPPQEEKPPVLKWIFLLILFGAAAWGYTHRDLVNQKIAYLMHAHHDQQQPVQALAPAQTAPPVPRQPAAAPVAPPPPPAPPVFVPNATPKALVVQDPCGAFRGNPAQLQVCNDQIKRIQRMKSDAAARDREFQAPPPAPAAPGKATNTVGR